MLSIGHRGAAGHAPENTIAALKQGIALGADLVEFDVQRTGDGEIVLFHDRTLERITGRAGLLCDTAMDVLQTLNAGRGEKIPTLGEALRAIQVAGREAASGAGRRVGAMIEMKGRGLASQVCSIVEDAVFGGPVIYASFWPQDLLDVRRIRPDAQTLVLIENLSADPRTLAQSVQATHAGLSIDCIDAGSVRALQAENIRVFVYTVDDPHDIDRVRSMGVDGVISDYPDRLRRNA